MSTSKAGEGIEKTGSLKASYISWNLDKSDFGEIPIQKCKLEDKKKFYEPNKIYQGGFDLIFTEFYCITNPEKLVLNGGSNGDVGSSIYLSFKSVTLNLKRPALARRRRKNFLLKLRIT